MAKAQYIGVSGVARKVKKNYIGVAGVARKVKKGYIGVGGVARQYFAGETPISSLAVGGTVQVAENGTPVDYIIVQIGTPGSSYYQNADGYWLLRKTVDTSGYYSTPDSDGDCLGQYDHKDALACIRAAESRYYSKYGAMLKSILLTPTLPFHATSDLSRVSTVTTNIFHLGHIESGSYTGYAGETALTYFKNTALASKADSTRVAYDASGESQNWWTRDNAGGGAYRPAYWDYSGKLMDTRYSRSNYYRPCIIVPKTAKLEDLLS